MVRTLLAANADVNAKDLDGRTPLIVASQEGYVEVVRTLLAAKADVNAKAANGFTAVIIASQNGHMDVAELLRQGVESPEQAVKTHRALSAEPFSVGNAQVELAFFGKDRTIALGHNFWTEKIKSAKTPEEVNLYAGLWLGAAQHDLTTGHEESAKVRLNEIMKVLTERNGDPLILASAQFRTAFLFLSESRWTEARDYAKESSDTFDRLLSKADPTRSKWLNWGGYDENPIERILGLQVLARAYRMNQDGRWQEAIDKAITLSQTFDGTSGSLYQASVSLKAQLSAAQ